MSYLLPHLRTGWAVDQAIINEEERVVCLRFGHDHDVTCMQMDEVLAGIAEDVKNFCAIYVVDVSEVRFGSVRVRGHVGGRRLQGMWREAAVPPWDRESYGRAGHTPGFSLLSLLCYSRMLQVRAHRPQLCRAYLLYGVRSRLKHGGGQESPPPSSSTCSLPTPHFSCT